MLLHKLKGSKFLTSLLLQYMFVIIKGVIVGFIVSFIINDDANYVLKVLCTWSWRGSVSCVQELHIPVAKIENPKAKSTAAIAN